MANGLYQERFQHQGWSADFLLIGHAVCWWREGKTLEISLFQVPGSVKDGYVVTQCQWQKEGAIVIEVKNWLMGAVLTDQLISQPLMFSACGSHGREKEKRIKAYLQHALINILY